MGWDSHLSASIGKLLFISFYFVCPVRDANNFALVDRYVFPDDRPVFQQTAIKCNKLDATSGFRPLLALCD
jgi:hypothetical protein